MAGSSALLGRDHHTELGGPHPFDLLPAGLQKLIESFAGLGKAGFLGGSLSFQFLQLLPPFVDDQ